MFRGVLLLLWLMSSPAMASLEDMVAATPVPNYVYLHASPAVGDFAAYRSVDGSQLMRIELAGIAGTADAPRFQVRVHWPEASGIAAGFFLEHAYHFEVNAEGVVMAATLERLPSGRMLPLQPAGPGDLGYIAQPDIREVTGGETLHTAAGDVVIDGILLYEENRATVAGPARITSTNLLSSAVPFGLVRQINAQETKVTIVELTQFIIEHSKASDAVTRVVDYLLERSKQQRTENGMQLVAFGRAGK